MLKIVAETAVHRCLICLMTCDTAGHTYICLSPEAISFGNRTMTSLTGCAAIEMDLMAEIYKSWNLVNADPRDRPVRLRVLPEVLYVWAVRFDGLVAGHTGFHFRDRFYFARIGHLMAFVAFEMSRNCVLFMAERNGLNRRRGRLCRENCAC
jgi:hypothetical protein